MANVSKIVLPDGTVCDIKDKTARELLLKTSKIITGTCSTGAGQTALVVTIPDYTLADNDILAITFANDVPPLPAAFAEAPVMVVIPSNLDLSLAVIRPWADCVASS